MSPLPATRVIPDGWSEHNRPAAEGTLTGLCKAERPVDIGDIEAGEAFPSDGPDIIWRKAPCSVQFLAHGAPTVVVDSIEVLATHRVSLPIRAITLQYGDMISVTSNPDDPHLNGRTLVVLAVESGTTNWTRDYLCEERNSAHGQ